MSDLLQLELETLHELGKDKLIELLSGDQTIQVQMTNFNLGFAQDPNDVAHGYLKAMFVGERLFPHCTNMQATEVRKDGLHPNYFILFTFSPRDRDAVVGQMLYLSALIGEGDDSDVMLELTEELDEFQDYVENHEVHFPELEQKYYDFLTKEEDEDYDESEEDEEGA